MRNQQNFQIIKIMDRPEIVDNRYMRMARIWAENSYCSRRQTGIEVVQVSDQKLN